MTISPDRSGVELYAVHREEWLSLASELLVSGHGLCSDTLDEMYGLPATDAEGDELSAALDLMISEIVDLIRGAVGEGGTWR